MPNHPNPADHCRAIGIEVGKEGHDKIRRDGIGGNVLTVKLIDTEEVVTSWGDGRLTVWHAHQRADFADFVKVEPPPVVTIDDYDNAFCRVNHGGSETFKVVGLDNARDIFGWNRSAKLARIGAEAIKSAIEADGKPADAEPVKAGAGTRYATECSGRYTIVRRDGERVGHYNSCSFVDPAVMDRLVNAGIAALNADAEPVAEGPYTTYACCGDQWVENDTGGRRNDLFIVGRTSHAIRQFGEQVVDEICSRHAREIAAELNGLHAKA